MATNLDRPQTCAICHGKAYGYNYDVVSCNACKMFFRRANVEGIGENCKSGGGCYDGDDFKKDRPRCRPCRYRKCIALGMHQHKSTDSDASPSPGTDTHPRQQAKKSMIVAVVQKPLVTQAHIDSRLIQQMLVLHHTRREVYLTINICEDPSFLDLVLEGSNLSKYKRPQPIEWEKTERKLKPWGSLGVLLIVEIVKAMSFYEELLLSDRVILLKNVAFKSHHLSIAFDSFMAKKGRVLAPNGEEMFPDQLFQIAECYDIIMDLLTSPMQPLLELNLTENEYLLLNMIMICNPALSGLSPSGQEILSKEQQAYAKLLLQVCMMRDPREGPARYGKILAVIEKLERQKDVTHRVVHTLRRKWKPDFHFSGVLTEACRLDSDRLPYMKTEI